MNRRTTPRDLAALAFVGALLGFGLGVLGSSVWVTLRAGGSLETLDPFAIFAHAPSSFEPMDETFRVAALATLAASFAAAIALPVAAYRPALTSHGTARWAEPEELRRANLALPLARLQGPVFAKLGSPRSRKPFISSSDIPHSLVVAPTGSGKGVGIVIPTLLTYGGSVICLDVKGENFANTARRRHALGDAVFKFAPYDEHGRTHRFNPLDDVARADPERRYTEAQRVSEALIALGGENVQGFLVSAKQIFAAAVLVVIERGTPTIGAVHDLLDGEGEGSFSDTFATLADETDIDEARSIFRRMAGISDRILSSYMSVLFDGGLGAWRDRFVRRATETSDFDLAAFRRRPMTLYVVIAPNDLKVLAPVVRILFQRTVATLQRAEPTPDEPWPVLLLLDEFPRLGRMSVLSEAITTVRSYGGRMMLVAQSLAGLKEVYGAEGAQNFLANCRLQLFMAPADADTPEYVSRAIGDMTRKVQAKTWRTGELGRTNVQEREEGARLIRPEQLRGLGATSVVVLVQDHPPVLARKVVYYADGQLGQLHRSQGGALPEPRTNGVTDNGSTALGRSDDAAITLPAPVVMVSDTPTEGPATRIKLATVDPTSCLRETTVHTSADGERKGETSEVDAVRAEQIALLARIAAVKERTSTAR